MPLDPGSRVGAYEIHSLLGAGGMGEVYRAQDTKLGRDVAIKVLPAAVSNDPGRLARFEREAKSLAALNHPNIAQIYAVEANAIVMEYVPGTTVHGPLPLETALDYAKQIASALEAAHEKGIIHRDLKPGNVMVTPEGVVKVLDFGLAGRATSESSVSPDLSPTLTMQATQAGIIIGTAAYMSPEQASGKAVDKRADVWSFGVMLWEMLVGSRLFEGETVSHTLADVLRADIDFGKLPAVTPPAIRQLLGRCLDRDVKNRLRDIGEARVAIEKYLFSPRTDLAPIAAVTPSTGVKPRRPIMAWSIAGVATLAAALLAFVHLREQAPVLEMTRFQVLPPERSSFATSVALSPDGRRFAFAVPGQDGRLVLWVQSMDSLEARLLPGTEGVGVAPFWSHDSRFVVFAVNGFPGRLKKVDAAGGAPQTLSEFAGLFRGGDWNAAGDIVYGAGDGVWHISDSGGPPKRLTIIDPARKEVQHAGPAFLPDGRTFVYLRASAIPENMGLYVGSLDAAPQAQSVSRLAVADSNAIHVPASGGSGGLLLFLRQRTLLAQPLDERSQFTGNATSIAENVGSTTSLGWFSASATGHLAYRTSGAATAITQLQWADRRGTRLGQVGPPMDIGSGGVQLSTDGKRVVVSRSDSSVLGVGAGGLLGAHVWTADLSRGIFSRVNPTAESESSPAISPDGRVAFTSTHDNAIGDVYWMSANGAGVPEPLLVKSPTVKHPNSFSPDGRFLIYDDHTAQRQDLWILPMASPAEGGERKPIPFLVTAADETFGQFSPDGKWVAYSSDESGNREVYVQGFAPDRVPAASGGKWQISTDGGDKPRWSRDGKELYYIAPDRKMMAVPVKIGTTFEPGVAVPLFETNVMSFMPYDVGADGRFLLNSRLETPASAAAPVTLVLNWQSLLKP